MDYKTMAEIVKARGDRIIEEKRIRSMRIRRITAGVSALCAAAVVGLGIWHSNTAKEPSSVDFGNSNVINTTDSPVASTSTTMGTNRINETTVTSVGTSAVSSSKTKAAVTTAKSTSETTAHSISSSTVRNTYVQSTAISASSVTNAAVTTTTDVTIITHRRVYYMNKLSGSFAALLIASSAVSNPIANAAPEGMRQIPYELFNSRYSLEDYPYDKWHENESAFDFDENGKFDIHDIYHLYCLANGDEALNNSGINYDINNDGEFDEHDVGALISYFTCYNEITRDYIDPKYYGADNEVSNNFVKCFTEETETFYGLYDIAAKAIEDRADLLDVDGSGIFDMGDIMDIYFFRKIFDEPAVLYAEMDPENLSYDDKLRIYNELSAVKFPSESEAKCLELLSSLKDDKVISAVFSDYLIKYYFENEQFRPEYSDSNYYEYLWDTRYDNRKNDSPIYKDILRDFETAVENTEWEMKLSSSDIRTNVDMTNIDAEYTVYRKKVEQGLLPEPDVNLDGRINMFDHTACEDIFNNYRYAKSDRYSDEMIYNFLNNFDLNENGISGDAADCSIAQIYICEKLGVKTKKEQEYDSFREAWINGEVSNYPWDGTNCLDGTKYPLTDPDDLFSLCYNYVYAFNYASKEVRQFIYDRYYVNVEAGIIPAPDVDMNGIIDEKDYIYAENTLYSQTHTSENINTVPDEIMDNYIKNFDLDGSGVSGDAMDTEIILEYVSRKCGIDTSDLETMAWNARGQYTNTQLADPLGTTTVPFDSRVTTTVTAAAPYSSKKGDANCDSDLDLSDAVIVMQALANPNKYDVGGTAKNPITEQGKLNADVDKSAAGLTVSDALCIQQYLLGNKSSLA